MEMYDSYYELILDTFNTLCEHCKKNNIPLDINRVKAEMDKVDKYCNGKCAHIEIGESLYYLFKLFHDVLHVDITASIDLTLLYEYVKEKRSYKLCIPEYSYRNIYNILINTFTVKYSAIPCDKMKASFKLMSISKDYVNNMINYYSNINPFLGEFIKDVLSSKGVSTNQNTITIPAFNFYN